MNLFQKIKLKKEHKLRHLKFSKCDRVIIISSFDDLKYRVGSIVAHQVAFLFNYYKVELDIYPSSFQLKQHLIPILLKEDELEFEDKSKERDWKIKQILND